MRDYSSDAPVSSEDPRHHRYVDIIMRGMSRRVFKVGDLLWMNKSTCGERTGPRCRPNGRGTLLGEHPVREDQREKPY